MKSVLLVVAACFLFPWASYAQQKPWECGCGDYVKIALGTTWYKNSTSQQRDYWHLLEVFETGLGELNKTLSGDTSGSYAAIFGGSLALSQTDYELHYTEYKQRIEDKIKEVYQNSSISQYPIELINGLDACHSSCSNRPTVSCTALSSDADTVIFSVKYRRPPDIPDVQPKFRSSILKPANVRAVGDQSSVNGRFVAVGVNEFRFDRSHHADEFTISAKVQPSADSCSAAVPARASQTAMPRYNSFCIFSDVGFADQYSTHNKPGGGYSRTYTCNNVKPGAKFLAVYSGIGRVNDASPRNWFGFWLTTSKEMEDPAVVDSPKSDYTNRKSFVLSNALAGSVPSTGPNAGTASVNAELAFCQVDAGIAVTCSTEGNTRLIILIY